MFQTYDDPGGPTLGRKHLPRLRKALKAAGLDGFIVPHEDEWQNEYVPPAYDRLAWTTGFTGSAGAAVVMTDEAAVFTDGRYTLQVRAQVDGDLFAYRDLVDGGVPAYIRERGQRGARIGYDPKLHSPDSLDRLRSAADAAGVNLVPVARNPIDEIWDDRPAIPMAKVVSQQETYTGENASSKRHRLADAHLAQLHFLEVGLDPDLLQRDHRHQRRAGGDALADLHGALGHLTRHRRRQLGALHRQIDPVSRAANRSLRRHQPHPRGTEIQRVAIRICYGRACPRQDLAREPRLCQGGFLRQLSRSISRRNRPSRQYLDARHPTR